MKIRLLITFVAASALSGCASTYDYAAGSAPGGYYVGRAPAASYGPFDSGYGYGGMSLGYGYGNYGRFGGYGYSRPYYGYGGYYPYYIYRPHHHNHNDKPDPDNDRAPPWRNPQDGRYRESGRVKIPPQNRIPQSPGQPRVVGDGRQPSGNTGIRVRPSGDQPRRMSEPSPPRMVERSRPPERSAPPPRSENRGRMRNEEP